jgi:hypothetical protein
MGLGRWICDSSSYNDNNNDYDNNNNDYYKYNYPDYDDINDSNYFAHIHHCTEYYVSIEVR